MGKCACKDLFRTVWETEEILEDWNCGLIVKLPKKGNLTDCGNWRGITLLSVPAKVMGRAIITRLHDAVDGMLREEQAGFRTWRSTTEHILCCEISSNNRWNGMQVCTLFVQYLNTWYSISAAFSILLFLHKD